jgi:dienelactone hydrolase
MAQTAVGSSWSGQCLTLIISSKHADWEAKGLAGPDSVQGNHMASGRSIGRKVLAIHWLLVLFLLVAPPTARADDFVQENTFFRVNIGGSSFRLEGLVVKRADATGRLPVAIFAHGKPTNQQGMLDLHATVFLEQAKDLANRGWLAVAVMRRGFGQSDGPLAVPLSCQSTSFVERFSSDADDLAATLEAIESRPDADTTRVIAIGVSAGGGAVMALSARNPRNLRAVINISGGLYAQGCPKEDVLVQAFKDFGTKSRVPTLWMYAKNDTSFSPEVVALMRNAFLDGGGNVKLVMFDPIGKDGHTALFSSGDGRLKWLQEMDALLRFQKLPTFQRPEVTALLKKLNIQEQRRGFVESFIAAPFEKALVETTGDKKLYDGYGAPTMEAARSFALNRCRMQSPPEQCKIVMENNLWIN